MGHNPRFGRWSRDEWRGYCPTLADMQRRGWSLTKRCPSCALVMAVPLEGLVRVHGPGWDPWGQTAPCPRLFCPGRMRLRAYSPRAGQYVDV